MPAEHAPFVHRMQELQDAKEGLPIHTHRPAPVGPAIVFGKQLFRRVAQPFINELLRKQAFFNENVVSFGHAIFRDLRSLESSVLGVRAGLDTRMRRLEDTVAKLEARLADSVPASTSQPKPNANGSAKAH